MIGLKRGTVKLLPYNKKWAELFEREKRKLNEKLGDLVIDIQHVGSTAIPAVPAKPIIDIAVGVHSTKDVKKLVKPLKELGYKDAGWVGVPGVNFLFTKGPGSRRTHYLHVFKYNGVSWKNDLLFRDYIIKYRGRAKQYVKLKKRLAKSFADDRYKYTAAKAKFITDTIKKAKLR